MVTSVPWQLTSSERVKALQPHVGSRRRTAGNLRLNPASAMRGTDVGHRRPRERRQLRGAPRRPGGLRPLCVARRTGSGAGHRGPRILLARRGYRGDRPVAGPDRVAVPDRRRGRRRLLRSGIRRPGSGARAQGAGGGQSAGTARRSQLVRRGANRSRMPARRVGAPGSGSTWARTVAPAFTATTAMNWSPTCAAGSCPPECSTGSADARLAAGRPVARGRRRRRPAPRGAHARGRASGPSTKVVEGDYHARAAGGRAQLAGAGDGLLAVAPRRRRASTATWSPTGRNPAPGMTAWDLYGGAGVFAAVLGDAVGESGRVLTVDTSRGGVGRRPGRAGRSAAGRRRHRFGAPGAGGPDRAVPMWRCWIRRDRAPDAR